MTTYRTIAASELTDEQYATWLRLHQSNPGLTSPFFHPELVRVVDSVRDDVEIAVIEKEATAVGFFPFQRGPGDVAQALCGRLSEFHGVVVDSETEWSPQELVRSAGISSWHFDHLPESQERFEDCIWGTSESPYMDLRKGFKEYRATLRERGRTVSQIERKSRKLAREVGDLRFVYHDSSSETLAALIDWKNKQHLETGVLPVMTRRWVTQLLETVHQTTAVGFQGVMTSLYAGDELIAVHLGIASNDALHIWFPAYNADYEKYSPGLILLLQLAESATERNLRRIDLGRGPERYKQNMKSDDLVVAEGAVDRRYLSGRLHRQWYHTKQWMRTSPWHAQLEYPLQASRRLRQWMAFR